MIRALSDVQRAASSIHMGSHFLASASCGDPTAIAIWNLAEPTMPPRLLQGHTRAVTAFASGRAGDVLISAATKGEVLLWCLDVEENFAPESDRYEVLLDDVSGIGTLALDPSEELLAACVDSNIFIVQVDSARVTCRLVGHRGPVTMAHFRDDAPKQLISISEDRTFKVWDLSAQACLFQSHIMSSSPCVSLAIEAKWSRFAIADAEGAHSRIVAPAPIGVAWLHLCRRLFL